MNQTDTLLTYDQWCQLFKKHLKKTIKHKVYRFQAIVMEEHAWSVICKRSVSAAPGKAKGRKTKFLANLFELLKAQDETHPIMEHAYDYVLHIELSADETNAIISLQRKATYEFVFRNEIIPLSGK